MGISDVERMESGVIFKLTASATFPSIFFLSLGSLLSLCNSISFYLYFWNCVRFCIHVHLCVSVLFVCVCACACVCVFMSLCVWLTVTDFLLLVSLLTPELLEFQQYSIVFSYRSLWLQSPPVAQCSYLFRVTRPDLLSLFQKKSRNQENYFKVKA